MANSALPRDNISPELRNSLNKLEQFSNQTSAEKTAALDVFTDTEQGVVPASGGGTDNFLRADGEWAAPPPPVFLQCLQTTYTANADLTTALPIDDTIPLVTEGAEILSLSITPASTSNKIFAQVKLWGTGGLQLVAAALFRGSTCITATQWLAGTTYSEHAGMDILDSPASTSAQTYSVRVGTNGGTAARMNGSPSGRFFGGAGACTLTLMEIAG